MNQARRRAHARWYGMVQRCTNPANKDWKYYGARGISICPEWLGSFQAYYDFVGDRPEGMTLDRIDNDGDYSPANVRWAAPSEQRANQRPVKHYSLSERTTCAHGHTYDEANSYIAPSGRRTCRTCNREAVERYRTTNPRKQTIGANS